MLRFNEPCRAFFLGTVLQHPSKTSLRRRSTRSFGDVCFLFDVLSDLPTPCVCERKRCMTDKIYFWCFLFFWTVFSLPNKICILASSDWIHGSDINRGGEWGGRVTFCEIAAVLKKKKKKKVSDLCLSEYCESPDWLWEGFTRRRPEQPVSSFTGTHTDSHGPYRQKMCHSWCILLYKEAYHVRREEADVPTAPVGFGCWPLLTAEGSHLTVAQLCPHQVCQSKSQV